MNKLSEILEYNDNHRVHKIADTIGLLELDEINYKQVISNDIGGALILPKKHKSIINKSELYYVNRQERYNDYCNTYFPIISRILNEVSGVALCGGAALWLYEQSCICDRSKMVILSEKNIPKDFDLFIYESENLSPQELVYFQNKKINDIIQIILADNKYTLRLFLVKGVITMKLYSKSSIRTDTNICIQIILRDYFSISEILHSFDIPCCSIAWDGKTTYLTKLAEWSIVHGLNIIIPKYRSNTYESRLIKYFNNRKFGLLLPNLKLPNDEKIIHLPNMSFHIFHTDDNIAIADVYISNFELLNIIYSTQEQFRELDYDKLTDHYMINLFDSVDNQKILQKNCYLIMNQKKYFEKYLYIYSQNMFYNFIQLSISDIISETAYKKWIQKYIKKNIIQYQDAYILNETLIKDITKHEFENFYEKNNIKFINLQLKNLDEKLNDKKFLKQSGGKLFILNKLIQNLIEHLMSIYKLQMDEILDFNIHLNRNEPLTGSLHPSKQTDDEWYGKYHTNPIKMIKYQSIKQFIDKHISDISKESKICPLCFENIHYLHANAIVLKCGHIYHEKNDELCEGINKWFSKTSKPSCPECRESYPVEETKFCGCSSL